MVLIPKLQETGCLLALAAMSVYVFGCRPRTRTVSVGFGLVKRYLLPEVVSVADLGTIEKSEADEFRIKNDVTIKCVYEEAIYPLY
jgi:hypothetical protein